MPMKNESAATLPALLETVLKIRDSCEPGTRLWFRGASCSAHQLLPRIMRDGKPAEAVFDREARLITRFRQRSQPYWPAGYPQNEWEQMFAMQHFGLPTRLLDWSENLFVATYFALEHSSTHSHEGKCVPVVWCVDPTLWNRSVPPLSEFAPEVHVLTTADEELKPFQPTTNHKRSRTPVALYGAHNSKRIVAQRGNFFVWGKEPRTMECVAGQLEEQVLWKIELTSPREGMFADLRDIGFSETIVYPEMQSLASELTRTVGWRE
jgi:hypothetical protein